MIHVLVIAVFMVVLLRDASPEPAAYEAIGPWWSAGIMLGMMGSLVLLAHAVCLMAARGVQGRRWVGWFRWSERVVGWSRPAIVVVHAVGVFVLGWVDAVREVVPSGFGMDELAAVTPALMGITATWWSWHPLEHWARMQELLPELERGLPVYGPPTRGEYVLSAVRHHLAIIVVPISLITVWGELVETAAGWFVADRDPGMVETVRVAGVGVQLAGVAAVFGLMPPVMRRLWDTVSLGPGELRDRLMDVCRGHGVRVRELLVWRTHGTMVNAAVLGFVPRFRYILVTDSLLDRLPAREVEAVMAHEIAHVRLRHMAWLAGALIGSVLVAGVGVWWMSGLVGLAGGYMEAAAPVVSLIAGLVVFGYVSRAFERQSDAFAARHLSGTSETVTGEAAATMIAALTGVAAGNRVSADRWTWRHGSIAGRVSHLRGLVATPVHAMPVDRRVRAMKLGIGVMMVMGIGLAALVG